MWGFSTTLPGSSIPTSKGPTILWGPLGPLTIHRQVGGCSKGVDPAASLGKSELIQFIVRAEPYNSMGRL